MSHVIERRIYPTTFRYTATRDVKGSKGRQRWARAVTYGTVDSYGSMWAPGVFNAELELRMPTLLYGHDWYSIAHVLGKGIDYKDVRKADQHGLPGCDVLVEFEDPEQIPNAGIAMALVASGTLRDVSVGFDRKEWLRKADLSDEQLAAGAEELLTKAAMDELSIVVRGAVPGAAMRRKPALTSRQIDLEARAAAEWVSRTYGARNAEQAARARREMGGTLDEFTRRVVAGKATLQRVRVKGQPWPY